MGHGELQNSAVATPIRKGSLRSPFFGSTADQMPTGSLPLRWAACLLRSLTPCA
jgi:hypothetical protein